MSGIDVSILLVNYHQASLVADVVKSVNAQSTGFSYEIIIVDNSESAEEVALLHTLLDDQGNVLIVVPGKNLGFGKGNNFGADYSRGKYLFFLNTDTLLLNNAIFELFAFLEKNSSCAIVGPNLFTKNEEPNHSFVPFTKNISGEKKMSGLRNWLSIHLFHKRLDFNYDSRPLQIFGYVCGAALMVRRETFFALGGFDKDIFMYAEEALLCFRAIHEMNMQIFNVPSARIVHFEGSSFGGMTPYRAKTFVEGNCLYYVKAFDEKTCLRYLRVMQRMLKIRLFSATVRHSGKQGEISVMLEAYREKENELIHRRVKRS